MDDRPIHERLDQRISLQKLEVFCLVVELNGVGRAAEHLLVAQPVVSAHLRTLQERLGAKLLYRDGRRARLTEAGEAVYAWAREVLSRRAELARDLEGLEDGSAGQSVIGSSMSAGSYLLPPILARFRRLHPRARITLDVSDPERTIQAVEVGRCDFAIVMAHPTQDSPTIELEQLGHDDLVVVAGVDSPTPSSITPEELEQLPFICSPAGLIRRQLTDHALATVGISQRNVVLELGHPEAMKRAARDGLGVTVLLRSALTDELEAGLLREIAVEDFDARVPILLVQRGDKRLSPLQEQLLAAIREAVEEREGAPQALA